MGVKDQSVSQLPICFVLACLRIRLALDVHRTRGVHCGSMHGRGALLVYVYLYLVATYIYQNEKTAATAATLRDCRESAGANIREMRVLLF